ncbi:hypothetical protein G6011_02210 [Alternaria panax]|uniref:Uncharacterized protein n=1 Tax=Alternaria panax TaxID=48097 RepID=A0AAD4FDZ3_9PLEO|nr:hypothetical protein G6011_02210 [Alternaria panax]
MTSLTTTTPTTTYNYIYTTYTNASPIPFTKPTEFPSVFSYGPAVGCASNSVAPEQSTQPSNHPIGRPEGLNGGCVISNDADVNDHAFWDMYACCSSNDSTASGSPFPCTASCSTTDDQNFLELGECLSKRVEIVICKPPFDKINRNLTDPDAASSSSSGTAAQSTSTGTISESGTASASASAADSTGAASAVGVIQSASSKGGLVLFAIMAFGSAAGMFL